MKVNIDKHKLVVSHLSSFVFVVAHKSDSQTFVVFSELSLERLRPKPVCFFWESPNSFQARVSVVVVVVGKLLDIFIIKKKRE